MKSEVSSRKMLLKKVLATWWLIALLLVLIMLFKDPVDTDPSIDAACSPTSYFGFLKVWLFHLLFSRVGRPFPFVSVDRVMSDQAMRREPCWSHNVRKPGGSASASFSSYKHFRKQQAAVEALCSSTTTDYTSSLVEAEDETESYGGSPPLASRMVLFLIWIFAHNQLTKLETNFTILSLGGHNSYLFWIFAHNQ